MTDWMTRLQRWPVGLVGEFLGTRGIKDPQARAARRWLRKLLKTDAECLALTKLLIDKGIVGRAEYEAALREAARTACSELEHEFPGFSANDEGVEVSMPRAATTMKDWPK